VREVGRAGADALQELDEEGASAAEEEQGLSMKLVALEQMCAKSWTRRALAVRQRIALAAPLSELI
jgi:hypothetical protein